MTRTGADGDIAREVLMAYADGELDALAAKRVERAIAADPALAAEVEQHRMLRTMLAERFAPLAVAPVPDRLSALLQLPAVTDLAEARAARTARAPRPMAWASGIALAASLLLGIAVGQRLGLSAAGTIDGGTVVASGPLARALDTQLASAVRRPAVRMLVTFRDRSGVLCRSFSGEVLSGIACRSGGQWALRETRMAQAAPDSAYRQAGSADAALMADAQDMMAGDPLDAAAEAGARAKGWR